MKKRILIAIGFLLIVKNKLLAQQWAMDEAYDDWRDTSSDGFFPQTSLAYINHHWNCLVCKTIL